MSVCSNGRLLQCPSAPMGGCSNVRLLQWASAPKGVSFQWNSTDPTCYIVFSIRQAAINDNIDLNLLLYQFRPSPLYRKRTPFGGKCEQYFDWPLCLCCLKNTARDVGSQKHCVAGTTELEAHMSGTDSSGTHVNIPGLPIFIPLVAHCCHASLLWTQY